MKKFFAFAAAAMMMFSASAGTLSLYSHDIESYFVPINSMWYETPGNKTQVLYPAADLEAMNGKQITAITFYTDGDGVKMDGGLLELYMGETEATVMTDFIKDLSLVGSVSMTKQEGDSVALTLNFTTPYEYKGGNLVFGTLVKEAGNFTMTYFGGQAVNYNNCIYVGNYQGYNEYKQFLPKTTFTYEGGEDPQPEVLRGDVNGDKQVNISDVTALINYLLSKDESAIVVANADCNLDNGAITISDVTALINYLLSKSW